MLHSGVAGSELLAQSTAPAGIRAVGRPRRICPATNRVIAQVLELRVRQLLASGRQVLVVGDLNISPQPQDNCCPSDTFSSRPDRVWLNSLLQVLHVAAFDVLPAAPGCGQLPLLAGFGQMSQHCGVIFVRNAKVWLFLNAWIAQAKKMQHNF
jgi:hypothetical protein